MRILAILFIYFLVLVDWFALNGATRLDTVKHFEETGLNRFRLYC